MGLSRLATSFVLGYHGCDAAVARSLVSDKTAMIPSSRSYDWLGTGVYFWEADPQRAQEWADWKVARGDYGEAAIVGAVIDLGECLDLLSRGAVDLLKVAHAALATEKASEGEALPVNGNAGGDLNNDRVLRYLDRAVIDHLHQMLTVAQARDHQVRPFDTVRGLFSEGPKIYPGAGFREKTHVQIAVRNLACIKGVFHPR